jgi:predicted ribosomally synthesized peptide with SipW-like signal peptide
MEKSKKISFTSIAIVVLAILLTVSLTMGGTLAWFANQNQADTTLTMGNAVGVAVVDSTGSNGSMDRLSFTFHTGRNGELMLPGAQIDPDVQAMISKSNTPVILRAVVTFEVTLDKRLTPEEMALVAKQAGSELIPGSGDTAGKYFVTVPSAVDGTIGADKVQTELKLLNMMYKSFFQNLEESALYNGWVYRESNLHIDADDVATDSRGVASSTYYASGYTQYPDTPIKAKAGRNAGPGRQQQMDATKSEVLGTEKANVAYNAFYFRGWATFNDGTDNKMDGLATTITGKGSETKYVNRGIDGIYKENYQDGSFIGSEYHAGGRQYKVTRALAGDTTGLGGLTDPNNNQYAILEGILDKDTNVITTYADPLGYKLGDPTSNGAKEKDLKVLNVSTHTGAYAATNLVDSWQSSGTQKAEEDMMCVINTIEGKQRIPLFTTSFLLPQTWTQDAFADRSMRLNVTFQVMQADYLASGTSHHCSVELAESRFDDVTLWATTEDVKTNALLVAGQPYVKDVQGQPNFNNPAYWTEDPYSNTPKPPAGD